MAEVVIYVIFIVFSNYWGLLLKLYIPVKVTLKNLPLCRVKVPGPVLRLVVKVRGAGVRAARA